MKGYTMTPAQARVAREETVKSLRPYIENQFRDHPDAACVAVMVAQYYNDEAHDAVHGQLLVTRASTPPSNFSEYAYEDEEEEATKKGPHLIETRSIFMLSYERAEDDRVHWDDNRDAIPVWAAFARGGEDVWNPAVSFDRQMNETWHPMVRPYADGIMPSWELNSAQEEEDEDEIA